MVNSRVPLQEDCVNRRSEVHRFGLAGAVRTSVLKQSMHAMARFKSLDPSCVDSNSLTPCLSGCSRRLFRGAQCLFIGFLPLLVAGCVSPATVPFPQTSRLEYNRELMDDVTPEAWHPGAVWAFAILAEDGTLETELTFKVATDPVNTCSSGEWRKLELVASNVDPSIPWYSPSYSVSGRLLTIVMSGWCDGREIQGELTGRWFVGEVMQGAFGNHDATRQRVIGRRIDE